MPLETTCRVCRRPFEPTREDVIAGPDPCWSCLVCRREQQGGYVDGDQGAEVAAEVLDVGDLPEPRLDDSKGVA